MLYNHDTTEPWDESELEPLERPDMLAARADFVELVARKIREHVWHRPPEALILAAMYVATDPRGASSSVLAGRLRAFYDETGSWAHVLRAVADAIQSYESQVAGTADE